MTDDHLQTLSFYLVKHWRLIHLLTISCLKLFNYLKRCYSFYLVLWLHFPPESWLHNSVFERKKKRTLFSYHGSTESQSDFNPKDPEACGQKRVQKLNQSDAPWPMGHVNETKWYPIWHQARKKVILGDSRWQLRCLFFFFLFFF